MAEYEKVDGPIPDKDPKPTDITCPGCGKQKLVVKRTTGKQGRNETQHLLCELCNYQDSRVVDRISGEIILDRELSSGKFGNKSNR